MQTTAERASLLIGGAARTADSAVPVRNPARFEEVVGTVDAGTPRDVDDAVAAAERVFAQWAALGARERARLLLAAAAALETNAAERARLLTREHGKVLWESEQRDVRAGIGVLRYYCGLAEEFEREAVTRDQRGTIVIARRPIGVGAVIVPWNFPITLCFLMLAPMLVAGNTAVVKPPTYVPLALDETLRILAEHLPPGVVNIVPGSGAVVGNALATHARVRKLSFTGSTEVGRELIRACAGTVKVMSMELGGNDPALVLESATLSDKLIRDLVTATFTSSGQICYAVKRIYVHRSHYAAFVERFSAAVDEIVVGDGLDPSSTIGPINNQPQFESVRSLLERTQASGATVRVLGRKGNVDHWERGYFMLPAVVTDAAPDADVVACEQFGPVVPVLPFDSEDDAVALANGTEYGLAASVWTDDVDHGFALGARIQAGTVFVNTHRLGASDATMPFGGFKQSGIGRGHGFVGLEEASELQTLAHRIDM